MRTEPDETPLMRTSLSAAAVFLAACFASPLSAGDEKVRVVGIDGQRNHK